MFSKKIVIEINFGENVVSSFYENLITYLQKKISFILPRINSKSKILVYQYSKIENKKTTIFKLDIKGKNKPVIL